MTKKKTPEEIKKEVLDEITIMFNELYVGIDMPDMDSRKIRAFVKKALNMYDTKNYYNNRIKGRKNE